MTSELAILIYQSLDELRFDRFSHPVIDWLQNNGHRPFTLDSFSDTNNLGYAKELIRQDDNLIFLVLFDLGDNTRNLPLLLKEAIKRKNCPILSLGSHPLLLKLGKESVKVFEYEKELFAALNKNYLQ